MNRAKTAGFEVDVGARTTHHFMYPESAMNLWPGVHLVLVPFKPLDLKWVTSAFSTGELTQCVTSAILALWEQLLLLESRGHGLGDEGLRGLWHPTALQSGESAPTGLGHPAAPYPHEWDGSCPGCASSRGQAMGHHRVRPGNCGCCGSRCWLLQQTICP